MQPQRLVWLASLTLIALIALLVAWELWLAPIRPGGSWLVLKALPLLAALRGTLAGRRYTYQWSSLLALGYLGEGLVRATSDPGWSAQLAWAEVVLATAWFGQCLAYAKLTRPSRQGGGAPAA